MTIYYTHTPSPIGPLLLLASARGLHGLHMADGRHSPVGIAAHWIADSAPFTAVIEQLDAYFSGQRQDFDIELDMLGQGTNFQQTVWSALRDIPYGQTISYGELARRVRNPNAMRAVGLANGRNPVSIIVPCHRVIGADGSLTGYGGGIERKQFLLKLERAQPMVQPRKNS